MFTFRIRIGISRKQGCQDLHGLFCQMQRPTLTLRLPHRYDVRELSFFYLEGVCLCDDRSPILTARWCMCKKVFAEHFAAYPGITHNYEVTTFMIDNTQMIPIQIEQLCPIKMFVKFMLGWAGVDFTTIVLYAVHCIYDSGYKHVFFI